MTKKRKPSTAARAGKATGKPAGKGAAGKGRRPPGGGPGHSKPAPAPAPAAQPPAAVAAAMPVGAYWLYGQHALQAALANPARRKLRLVGLPGQIERLSPPPGLALETVERERLGRLLPAGAVEQGAALLVEPLAPPALPALLASLPAPVPGERQLVVALDQVTDPQNVGAIVRSAAAFGALAVLSTLRNAASEGGALAKAASGGLEAVPYLQEPNLARSLDELKAAGFWVVGLAGEAQTTLGRTELPERLALVLGAEGPGLRRLTRERCDFLVRLPTRGALRDLNVSNAAAVALYALLADAP
jgi:23S rRNA (guanosine2251-2'-O)-methyltransferase